LNEIKVRRFAQQLLPVWDAKTPLTSTIMKASYKAALLSMLVFPGVGHLYLKKYSRALGIIFPVFIGFGYMIWSAVASALDRFEEAMVKVRGGTPNLHELSDIFGLKISPIGPYSEAVFYGIICIWIFAVIDAYRIGKQRELRDEETSPV
jgi:hypothetical protein